MSSIRINWVGSSQELRPLLGQINQHCPEFTFLFTEYPQPGTEAELYCIELSLYPEIQPRVEHITSPPSVIFGTSPEVFSFASWTNCSDALMLPLDIREFCFRMYRNALHKLIDFGEARIRFNESYLTGPAETMEISYNEFLLLRMFSNNPGKIFSKDTIAEYLGLKTGYGSRNVDMHISKLRGKLLAAMGMTAETRFDPLENLRNKGYRIARRLVDNL